MLYSCPQCHDTSPHDARFCITCGLPLDPTLSAAAAPSMCATVASGPTIPLASRHGAGGVGTHGPGQHRAWWPAQWVRVPPPVQLLSSVVGGSCGLTYGLTMRSGPEVWLVVGLCLS